MSKKGFLKRAVSLVMAVVMVVLLFPTTAEAANSTSKFSAPYKNSTYYTKLMNAKNASYSSKAAKFVAIVESQVGYHEGLKYTDLDGKLSGGTTSAKDLSYLKNGKYEDYKGYLDVCEYNFWYYGASDSSSVSKYGSSTKTVRKATFPVSNYDKPWCAAFVSWCAAQAGVSALVPANVGCGYLKRAILGKGGQEVAEANRQPGDVIFYYCAACKKTSHTGIVSSDIKYSIEGNTNDGVKKVNISTSCTHTCMSGEHTATRIYVRPGFCTHSSTYNKITQQPTCQAAGVRTYYCKSCDAVVKTAAISKLEHSYDKYGYCESCNAFYSAKSTSVTAGVYTTTQKVTLHSTPYEKGKGGASNVVSQVPSGAAVAVDSAFKNVSGQTWYYVKYTNSDNKTVSGYIYGKYLKSKQNTFTFNEGSTARFKAAYNGTISIPKTSVQTKSGYTLKGFYIYKKSLGTNARYYTNQGTWNTIVQTISNGYSYKLYKPGSTYKLSSAWIDSYNKYTTSYVLVPVWEKTKTYTISYNANGGSGAPSSQTKTSGTALTLSSQRPSRSNYVFMGWSTSSTGSVVYAPGATYTADANVTLYAVWVKNPITWDSLYVKNITATTALVGCTVTADCSKINRIGLQMRTSSGTWKTVASWKVNSVLDYCTVQCGGSNAEAAALTKNTQYYYRFYVETTNVGTQYSGWKYFTTSSN